MAKLSEEERQRRALARARRQALENEERHHRDERKREEWEREGTRLTWEEYAAGVPCRGCGQPISGRDSDYRFKGLIHMSPEERARYDAEEVRYREQHPECRSYRWSVQGCITLHCGYCVRRR